MSATELMTDGTFGVEAAKAFSGLGRTVLYELMSQGRLKYVKVGTRRLISKRSLIEVLASGLPAEESKPEAGRKRKRSAAGV